MNKLIQSDYLIADVLPAPGYTRARGYCFKVINLDEYPDYLLFFRAPKNDSEQPAYWLIEPGICNRLFSDRPIVYISAFPKDLVKPKDLININTDVFNYDYSKLTYNSNGELAFDGQKLNPEVNQTSPLYGVELIVPNGKKALKNYSKLAIIPQNTEQTPVISGRRDVPVLYGDRILKIEAKITLLNKKSLRLEKTTDFHTSTKDGILAGLIGLIPPLIGILLILVVLKSLRRFFFSNENKPD